MPAFQNQCKTTYSGRLVMLFIALFLSFPSLAQDPKKEDLTKLSSDSRISYLFSHFFRNEDPVASMKFDALQNIAEALKDERMLDYVKMLKKVSEISGKPYGQQKGMYDSYAPIAEHSVFDDVKGSFYFIDGMNAFYNKDYATALPFLFLARKLLEKAGYQSYAHSDYYYNGFFNMYYYFEDYQNAANYCQLAINNTDEHPYRDLGFYNDMGLCYLKLKKYEQAQAAFEKGIAAAEKDNNANFKALIIGNLGNVLRVQGNYKDALPYLYTEAAANEKAIPENAAISRLYIANSLLHLDSADKAKAYLTPPTFKLPYWVFPGYDLVRLETWALYYQKTGNYNFADKYKDSLLALKDSLKTVFDFKKLTVLESSLQTEKYLNDKQELEIKAQNEKFTRNLVVAVLVLIFTGIFFWLNYRRKTGILLETQKLTEANLQLGQYVKNIKDKNELIEKMSSQLQDVNKANTSAETAEYVENLQSSVILTDDDWQEFKTLFEKAFPNFFHNLTTQYPGLTPAEMRLLALEKLQLPTKDMANMLGISADSIKKSRYRLRKKFPESTVLKGRE